MMILTFDLFTKLSDSGLHDPLVSLGDGLICIAASSRSSLAAYVGASLKTLSLVVT